MTVEIVPTLLCAAARPLFFRPASRTFDKKDEANHNPLIGMYTGQEGRGRAHSQNQSVPTDALLECEEVIWHQNWQHLSKTTFQSSAQLLLFLYVNSGLELKITQGAVQGLNMWTFFFFTELVSFLHLSSLSNWLTHTLMHASSVIYIHLYTVHIHRQRYTHTQMPS